MFWVDKTLQSPIIVCIETKKAPEKGETKMGTTLKFEGKFKVGDRIRGFDFRSSQDHYIEGVIKETGWVKNRSFKAFTIDIDKDPEGGRVGQIGLVPMGMASFDYDGRIILVHYCPDYPNDELTKPCECDKCDGACNNGNGGDCGECFACEDLQDNEKFWQANRADILGL